MRSKTIDKFVFTLGESGRFFDASGVKVNEGDFDLSMLVSRKDSQLLDFLVSISDMTLYQFIKIESPV